MNILAGHMLGDWLLQNRWLAVAKAKLWGLLLHCAIVTVSVAVFTGWWDFRAVLVFVSHFAIDRSGKDWWPRLLRQGTPDGDTPMWLGLVVDQALHIVTLALIASVG